MKICWHNMGKIRSSLGWRRDGNAVVVKLWSADVPDETR